MPLTATGQATVPPDFLRLAGDPLRWRLLSELGRSDRPVRELCALTERPQSLVSYHLGRLRAAGLVTMRRSSADRRDSYYSLDLPRCRQLLATAGTALHPGLRLAPAATADHSTPAGAARPRVLFLCTGNSARSQMAEALLERFSGGAIEAFSAGSHPRPLHANAVRAMREHGVDIAGRRSKHLDEFSQERFDYVVSLCDKVREVCPEFPDRPSVIHWSIANPADAGGTAAQSYPAFQATATELATRLRFLLELIEHGSTSEREI